MAVKRFVVVAGARFIGPKSATPLASSPHGRQWLFPFSITAFRSRFLIGLRYEDCDITVYTIKRDSLSIYNAYKCISISLPFICCSCQYCTLRLDFSNYYHACPAHRSATPILGNFTTLSLNL